MIVRRLFTAAGIAAALGVAAFAGGVSTADGQSGDGQNRRVRIHNQTGAVLQKGYLIADRVLRPALVTVAAPK